MREEDVLSVYHALIAVLVVVAITFGLIVVLS
jgi:hypothetical protein